MNDPIMNLKDLKYQFHLYMGEGAAFMMRSTSGSGGSTTEISIEDARIMFEKINGLITAHRLGKLKYTLEER